EFELFVKVKKPHPAVLEHYSQRPGYSKVPARCSFAGQAVPCSDPRVFGVCKKHHFAPGRRAFVFTHDLQQEPEFLGNLPESTLAYLQISWAEENFVDVVLMVPRADLARYPLSDETRFLLQALGVRLIEVDWVLPEFGPDVPKWAREAWCVSRDFFKLHALGLDYDAVVFYDNDVFVSPGDGSSLDVLFACAYQGFFLATALHGGFEPLTNAFFALRPSPALLRAVLRFLKTSEYDEDYGWNGMGFGPWGCLDSLDRWCFRAFHVGAECGQGLFYNLFFMADQVFWRALAQEPGAVRPLGLMLDGCIWLYENSMRVPGVPTVPNPCLDTYEDGRCSEIVAYHKVIEGRGCANLETLGPLGSLLKFQPDDEELDRIAGSTFAG
ncbi:unnamed protein product, partial [Polarella glacialis]